MSMSQALNNWATQRRARLAQRAKDKGMECTLTIPEVKELSLSTVCWYTLKPMTIPGRSSRAKHLHLTVDRLDYREGYTAENTVACCAAINSLKGNAEALLASGMFEPHEMVRALYQIADVIKEVHREDTRADTKHEW